MADVTEYGPHNESPGGGALTQELPVPGQTRAPADPAPSLRDLLPWSGMPWSGDEVRTTGPIRAIPGPGRHPAAGLTALVLIGLAAAFFGWVSAQPFWLSFGAGSPGTVTISSCSGGRCSGGFASSEFSAESVRVSGVPAGSRHKGATVNARMLTDRSGWAYAGSRSDLGVRWKIGFGIVLLCGLGCGLATGIRGLRDAGRSRLLVLWALSMGGPLAIFAGTLLAALL